MKAHNYFGIKTICLLEFPLLRFREREKRLAERGLKAKRVTIRVLYVRLRSYDSRGRRPAGRDDKTFFEMSPYLHGTRTVTLEPPFRIACVPFLR